jgi:hypothetical protein
MDIQFGRELEEDEVLRINLILKRKRCSNATCPNLIGDSDDPLRGIVHVSF